MRNTYQTEIYKEGGVFASLGQIRQEHSHTQHQDQLILADLLQSLINQSVNRSISKSINQSIN